MNNSIPFSDLISEINFKNNRICIVEHEYCSIDFIIRDLLKILKKNNQEINILSFYNSEDHYEKIIDFDNKSTIKIQSIYKNEIIENSYSYLIIDDVFTGKTLFGIKCKEIEGIYIYRSNSATETDMCSYDICILIKPLKSGVSSVYDGIIEIHQFDRTIFTGKYKVFRDETVYYSLC
ncbi:hypothetical protein CWI36_0111p0040 [Hamiltosporidium magnivora]|uniref:Uncharacterized protein n=1 Tax=Hamiltosporidium magnivora TaxID=148818 RepID=A0A4Q9LMB9_9MICR|nr:hypothetical protein CWI36_0111p0040 [Hamiltosporidium magnivora]